MKGLGVTGLCFCLGCLSLNAHAQEVQWHSATKTTAAAAKPIAVRPAASLERPTTPGLLPSSIAGSPIVDSQVKPASFQVSGFSSMKPLVRSQSPDKAASPEPQWPDDTDDKKESVDSSAKAAETKEPTPEPVLNPPASTLEFPGSQPPAVTAEAPPPTPIPTVTNQAPPCCEDPCCECEPCRVPRLYASAEYLLWWFRNSSTPPLVTTGPVSSQGVIGLPGTVVLFGGRGGDIDNEEHSGGRFSLGYWLDPCQKWGIESTFFFLNERASKYSFNSGTYPLLARPFFDLNNGTESSEIVAAPGRSSGSVNIVAPSRLWGIDANLRRNLCCGCQGRLDLIGGFRFLELNEGLHITEFGAVDPQVPRFGGSQFLVFDSFDTRNQFYGGQLGLSSEVRRGRWFVNARGLVALGTTYQSIDIAGGQVVTAPNGNSSSFQGGLLALPSNIGHFSTSHFSVVPEGGLNVGYQITDNLRAYVGYTFLYWTNVVRPGDQIDRVIDVNQIPNFTPGPTANQVRPVVPFKQSEFWAQGMNFGLEMRY